ncbi:hypothetical protein [Actinoplanes couchii]|uniref:hypothetical protein n=1 Tax=Actinoplanes couchii TaxID=403638 RepID=UPI001941BDF7|nr:hypothetical protein [Actinoplanes couchii]MDR6318811.1 hypothetical protein [Actinoplanes couchii]
MDDMSAEGRFIGHGSQATAQLVDDLHLDLLPAALDERRIAILAIGHCRPASSRRSIRRELDGEATIHPRRMVPNADDPATTIPIDRQPDGPPKSSRLHILRDSANPYFSGIRGD